MGPLRLRGALLAVTALAGCGGGDSPPQLVDGSQAADLPAELAGLDDGVLTRSVAKRESDFDIAEYEACGVPRDGEDRTVVERTGLHGLSLTVDSGFLLYGCDKISDPSTAEDPDRPYGGIWCGATRARIDEGKLNDPRLDICSNVDDDLTAFVWIEPQPNAKWVAVVDAGRREVYEVAADLPVRVTTTENIDPDGTASFDVEEYAADGRKVSEYVLEAAVAG